MRKFIAVVTTLGTYQVPYLPRYVGRYVGTYLPMYTQTHTMVLKRSQLRACLHKEIIYISPRRGLFPFLCPSKVGN